MTKARFTEEFKEEAVKQVIERGYTVPDAANRLGVTPQSLYKWIKACAPDEKEHYEPEIREVRRENLKLKAVLQRLGRHRVARIMRVNKIRAQRGYKRPGYRYHKPAVAAPNRLQQQFTIGRPDVAWVTDITYIRTYEGWLYLAVTLRSMAVNAGFSPVHPVTAHVTADGVKDTKTEIKRFIGGFFPLTTQQYFTREG